MKDFSFNPEIARLYGVDEAIFIHHLHFWIEHNAANGRHYFEDANCPGVFRHWTYNSAEALADLFPFWSKNKIDKLTRKMEANGLIHVGNYNKSKFDRTKWYALGEEIESFYRLNRNSQMAESETAKRLNEKQPNGGISNSQMAAPIPDNIPDSKPHKEIVDYLNQKTGKDFRHNTSSTKSSITARLNEGFSVDDFKAVVDNKVRDWRGDPYWSKYLRPSTLFGSKFESYLNEGGSNPEGSRWKEFE